MKEVVNRADEMQGRKKFLKAKAVRLATVMACVALCVAQTGFCTDAVVQRLVDQICSMLRYVGIVVVVIGVGKFALAMKDENPDGQTRAVYYAVAGIVLIGLKTIVDGLQLFNS